MNLILSPHEIEAMHASQFGGKARALAMMLRQGMQVPETVCLTAEAYVTYVTATGLQGLIHYELNRKRFEDMRWEEIWDTSLRIRNHFLKTPIPADLQAAWSVPIRRRFGNRAVVVRSSALGEDSSRASFAGLHESYVNVRGINAIVDHVRLVWASLWSDRALLYRQELGLDVEKSAMAVVIQEMVIGDRSGVVFGRNPMDASQVVIEAVYGLNQGLVDGTVEPDRWLLARATGQVLSHTAPRREKALVPVDEGVKLEPLTAEQRQTPPLTQGDIASVYTLTTAAESLFGTPQDVEWTFGENELYALQSRPITAESAQEGDDKRKWYLSLRRSLDSLKALRVKIQEELIPAMADEAAKLASRPLATLSDRELAEEIEIRQRSYEQWKGKYWQDCIPFAHGMRLFGQIYNDAVRPDDPFEFMDLLKGSEMVSLQRNQRLEALASWIRREPQIAERLKQRKIDDWDPAFRRAFEALYDEFGDLTWGQGRFLQDPNAVLGFIIQMASRPQRKTSPGDKERDPLEERFFSCFHDKQRAYAAEILDIGRASYKLRDDDNIYLGKIEGQVLAAVEEGRERMHKRERMDAFALGTVDVVKALRDDRYVPKRRTALKNPSPLGDFQLQARQLVGQPAGPGYAVGKARVILDPSALFQFEDGEILVCDAVDPNMTFVVPLASGIVERRGGMLIHGAIIAREYGLPCVTGVPDATRLISTGDRITIDGFLGIVIIGEITYQPKERNMRRDEKNI